MKTHIPPNEPVLTGSGSFPSADGELFRGSVDISARAVVAVRGELVVTSEEISFEPRPVERLLWRDSAFEHSVSALTSVELQSPRRLEFQVDETVVRVGGAEVPRLFAALEAALDADAIENRRDPSLRLKIWKAQLRRGFLGHPGLLCLTEDAVRFVLVGTIDHLIGVPPKQLFPLQAIIRLDRPREGQIALSTRDKRMVVEVRHTDAVFERLMRAYSRATPPGLWTSAKESVSSTLPRPALKQIRATWEDQLPQLMRLDLELIEPTIRVSSKVGTRRGWLVLFAESVAWLPLEGPSAGVAPVVLSLLDLEACLPTGRSLPGDLHLRMGDGVLRLVPVRGSAFTDRFWEVVGDRAAGSIRLQVDATDWNGERPIGPDFWNRRGTYRVAPPAALRPEVDVRLLGDEDSEDESIVKAELMDLSLGGCGLLLSTPLAADETVQVDIPLDDRTVELRGRVVTVEGRLTHVRQMGRRSQWQCGLEFDAQSRLEAGELRSLWMEMQQEAAQVRSGWIGPEMAADD